MQAILPQPASDQPPPPNPLDHQGMVRELARQYLGRGLSFDDLFQEGQIGLLTACRKFRPELGWKFSTYATPWIRQRMRRALENGGWPIRLPVHAHLALRRAARTGGPLRTSLGSPSAALADAADLCRRRNVGSFPLAGVTARPEGEDLRLERLRKNLSAAIDELPRRQARVLRGFYGLDGEPPQTLRHMASRLGVSHETVRLWVLSAIRRLRINLRSEEALSA